MKKKIFIWILLSLLVIIILGMVLLPGIAKNYAIKHSKELIGRQIDMDKLKLNYFTGMIKITEFKMYEADEKEVFISFDTLIVNLEPFQFFVDEFVMESFYLKGLKANVIQFDSTFNFDDLIAFHSNSNDTIPVDTTNVEPFHFQLSNIELKGAEITFDDRTIDKVTQLNDISFFIPFIGWNQDEKSEAGLRFAFKNEGYFQSVINVDPINGDFDAEITIFHLYLDAFREYAANYANISELHGLFNSTIDISGNIFEAEKSLVSGNFEILDFLLKDQQQRKFLGIKKLDCLLGEIDVANMSFVVDSLSLSEPYVFFELDSLSNNLEKIFLLTTEDTATLTGIASDSLINDSILPLYYAVNFIQIKNGTIDYTDNITGEPFDYHLSEIELNSDSIESTSDWISLYAQMKLNDRGTLVAEVAFNPANPMDINLEYVITDFQLGDLNIYSRHYMGFPIVYGDMYYKSETQIMDGQLTSENKLVMEHVELGEKSGGLYSLPLKFALFLLKDKHGVINLDIPVRGDLNDPRVNIGKIVWTTFKNLIVKVASAPFDFLAGLISVDPKDIQEIAFEYNDTLLSEKKLKQLDMLLELEQKKKGLEIELIYFNDTEKEKSQIAIDQAGKKFYEKTREDRNNNPEKFKEFVLSKTENDTLSLEEACLNLSDQLMLDSLVGLYGKTRFDIINRYLRQQNDSTLIQLSMSNPKAPKNVGSNPVFEVKYGILQENQEVK